ncbi:MAG: hypothetical protein QM767_00280 [Anaeromyxobacter sp.]
MTSRRRTAALAALAALLAGAAVGWPWLARGVVAPLSEAAWILLRLTVLAVDQRLWWLLVACAGPALLPWALRARLASAPTPVSPSPSPPPHADPVERWRSALALALAGRPEPRFYRWDPLVELLVLQAALEQRAEPDHRLHEALRSGALPLPPEVHALAFPPPPAPPGEPAARLRRAAAALRGRVRALTGAERAARRRAVEGLLAHLEDRLQVGTDHGHDG